MTMAVRFDGLLYSTVICRNAKVARTATGVAPDDGGNPTRPPFAGVGGSSTRHSPPNRVPAATWIRRPYVLTGRSVVMDAPSDAPGGHSRSASAERVTRIRRP